MVKRGKLEILRDILSIIRENNNSIRFTPLLRKSNVSSKKFYEYLDDLLGKQFVKENIDRKGIKFICLTDKGFKYLEKYQTIVQFIEEFEL